MGKYPLVKIGDVCHIEKGQIGIASAIPGEYPLVVTAKERKSSITYQFDTEAVCIPLVSSTGHGKKSLNHVHFQSGKFALGTILAAVIPNNPSQLSASFLQHYLQFYKDTKLVVLMKGAANVSLSIKSIASIEIPLPPIEEQNRLIAIFDKAKDFGDKFLDLAELQFKYINKLRQAILQEAIEGKLTAYWREQNPVKKGDPDFEAFALIEQIKMEKKKLITEGKLKKEKNLELIDVEKFPFDVPKSWVWGNLGDVAKGFDYGSSSKSQKQGKYPVLRMGNIQEGRINWSDLVFTDDEKELSKYKLEVNDLLFNRTNSRSLVGKTAIFDSDNIAIHAGYLVRFSMMMGVSTCYANYVMNSKLHREWCELVKIDALGQSNINATKLRRFPFPLPPFAEQRVIVDLVGRLITMVDKLEKQVLERKGQAEDLIQAVLQEAFGRKKHDV